MIGSFSSVGDFYVIQFVNQGTFAKLSLCHSAPSEDVEKVCCMVEKVQIVGDYKSSQ